MRILEKYTLRGYLAGLTWCLGIFVGLYLVLDLMGHLDEILRHRVPLKLLVSYYSMMIPLIFVQVAPFACLMASAYTLGNLNRYHELMAMRASGIDPFHIARPLILFGFLVSVSVGLVNEHFSPRAAFITHSIKETRLERPPDPKAPHRVLKTIQHLAAHGQGHALLYAKVFDPVEKKMGGVVILQHGPDLRLKRRITAERAAWTGSQWRFEEGTILHVNRQGETMGRPVPFKTKIIAAGDRPELLERSQMQSAFMNSQELSRYIQRFKTAGGSTIRKLQVDLYAKWATAFSCLVLTILGIPFAIQPTRGGTALGLSIALGAGLLFYAVNALAIALGKGGWLPPLIAVWISPVGFIGFGLREGWRRLA